MDPQDKPCLDPAAVLSPLGGARLCQVLLAGATVTLVAYGAGHSSPYGTFCMAAWCLCLGASLTEFLLEATRAWRRLPVSWPELTAAATMLLALLSGAASLIYPLVFLRSACPYGICGGRDYRIAATACSCACCAAFIAELRLARTRRGRPPAYMATCPGLLKVAQAAVTAVIFSFLACDAEFGHYPPALYCAAALALCLVAGMAVVGLAVCGRHASSCLAAACGLIGALLHASAVAVWHVFCLQTRRPGTGGGQGGCPRGSCPWDSRLAVAAFAYVNLLLYAADCACTLRACCASRRSRATPSDSTGHISFLKNSRRPQSTCTPHRVYLVS
uniref:Myeloid-associated differentiation marker-like protein 2 n=1 Tax=Paramormyrops kingsleyae TaxID=1676925 RepID=A0A3B3SDJ2_9TELE|nr:myeloid-associated differentiation marker-like protein 2 [Paramormyrops kingsleyae]